LEDARGGSKAAIPQGFAWEPPRLAIF